MSKPQLPLDGDSGGNESIRQAFTTVNNEQTDTRGQTDDSSTQKNRSTPSEDDYEITVPFAVRTGEIYYKTYKHFNSKQND